ncbi:DNA-binding protein H-NS (plasmid) [Pararobbsia alpina]|uniref:H-NS histone family protein n=1 Tax=Pararobbsia alpina TaxID=621374 RepID=UPI0039A45E2F
MPTYKELLAQRVELNAQIEQTRIAERDDVVADIKQKMADYEIDIEELVALKRGRKFSNKKAAAVPKYRDPTTGATWSGRGKSPSWIKGATNRDEFLI